MHVIIVGGGLAGLTLASSLEKAGVNFTLLEARDCIAPQVGASIAINAASLRILDQLGAADRIVSHAVPIRTVCHRKPDGTLISPPGNDWELLGARFHYQTAFIDRQLVLEALASSIHDKQKILLQRRVTSVNHDEDRVTVHCQDGSSFVGDVLIGCDGVNSMVRSEMWRLARLAEPGHFEQGVELQMTAEFRCLFGISTGMHKLGMAIGEVNYVYDEGCSFLSFCGKGGRTYWFFFQRMDKVYHKSDSEFPRFTHEDAQRTVDENGERLCHSTVRLKDLWANRACATLTPMEECLYKTWSWGRIGIVGDGSHKMTANHGAAGNNAIESAVASANELSRIRRNKGHVSLGSIRRALVNFQRQRQPRIDDTVKGAAMICRMQSLTTRKDRLMVNWVMPYASSFLADMYRDQIIGAEMLEYLPVPERSFLGTTPFNPSRGVGFSKKAGSRALSGCLLLLVGAIWTCTASVGARSSFGVVNNRLTPSTVNSMSWTHNAGFVVDAGTLYGLWLLEGARVCNRFSLVQLPVLFGTLAMVLHPAAVAPLYYFTHYRTSDLSGFTSADSRMVVTAYSRTIAPLILTTIFCSAIPSFRFLLARYPACVPLGIQLLQYAAVKSGVSLDTSDRDRLDPQRLSADLTCSRLTVVSLSSVSAASWLLSFGPLPYFSRLNATAVSFSWLCLSLSSVLWLLLLVNDLKQSGMLDDRSWYTLTLYGTCLVFICGPSAAVSLAWLAREEILLTRRENTAITRKRFQGKTLLEARPH